LAKSSIVPPQLLIYGRIIEEEIGG
jgi:hypothetical protein